MGPFAILCLVNFILTANGATNKIVWSPVENSTEIALAKWRILEAKMKEGTDNMLRQVIPMLTDSDVVVNEECSNDLLKVVLAIKEMKLWAHKLLDATGKPSAGLLYGKVGFYGSYKGCLDVVFPMDDYETTPTTGQYCLVKAALPLPPKPRQYLYVDTDVFEHLGNVTFKTELVEEIRKQAIVQYSASIRFGVCIPSSCSERDLTNVVQAALAGTEMLSGVVSCEVKKPMVIDTTQWVIIGIFVFFGLLNVASGLYDAIFYTEQKVQSIWVSFSPLRNFRKTMRTSETERMFSATDGVKTIALLWVVMCHTFLGIRETIMDNLIIAFGYRDRWSFQVISNGYLNVDMFYVISGMLVSFNIIKLVDERGFKWALVPIIIFKRVFRLLPAVLLVIGIVILMPLMGSGPTWIETMGTIADNCRQRWWHYLYFGSNVDHFQLMCLPHGWYVNVEFQCFLLTLVYLILLFKKPILGKLFLVVLWVSSVFVNGLVTYVNNFPPSQLLSIPDRDMIDDFFHKMYSTVHNHLCVYVVGAALGTLLARKQKFNISKKWLSLGWTVAISSALIVVYSLQPFNKVTRRATMAEAILYACFHKTVWASCWAWLIFVCAIGKGGLVNELFSWSGLQPLMRVSYPMYLVSWAITISYGPSSSDSIPGSVYVISWLFMADVVYGFLAAVGLRVLVEGPVDELSRIFFTWLVAGGAKKPEPSDGDTRLQDPDIWVTNGDKRTSSGVVNESFVYKNKDELY